VRKQVFIPGRFYVDIFVKSSKGNLIADQSVKLCKMTIWDSDVFHREEMQNLTQYDRKRVGKLIS